MSILEMKPRTSCPLCQSAHKQVLYTDRNRRDGLDVTASYVHCADCGMVYLDPIPDFRKFTGWDEIYVAEGAGSARGSPLLKAFSLLMWKWNGLFDQTAKLHLLPDGLGHVDRQRRRILCVGCNTGKHLASFASRGWEVWGVDLSGQAIARARARLPQGHFLHADIYVADLPETYFDAVRADALWEHLEDPVGFVRKCYRLLAPGGNLFLYVPNYESLLQKLCSRYNINSWVPFHVNFFTRESATRALTMAGFVDYHIQTNTHTSYYPNSLRQFLSRNKPSFDSQNLGWLIALFIVGSPLHRLIDAFGFGEELVVAAHKAADDEGLIQE